MNMLEALGQQPVMYALGVALAGFVWQGTAIALVVRALLACMGRRPAARARYAVACLGLLGMALLPVVTFWSVLASAPSGVSPAPDALGESVFTGATEAALVTWVGAWLEEARPWLLSAWLCGVLVLSLRTVLAWRRAQQIAWEGTRRPGDRVMLALVRVMERTGVSRPVLLLESAVIEVPTVVGWWRPIILLPASALTGLSVWQLEAVLAHELAHIRRHDYLVNLLQALVETALFYHPAVWWLSALIREEREHCADDVAVESCGDARLYSRTLAHLEQLRASAPALGVAANGGSLLLRIQRLLAVPERRAPLHPWRLAGSLAAALLVGVLGASLPARATGAAPEPSASQAPLMSGEVPPFGAGMTFPQRLSGDIPRIPESMMPPRYPPDTSWLLLVKCTLTVEGLATDCELINPKPELRELEAEVLRVMATSRFKPVTSQGSPIAVRYTFNTRITLPKP
jgi:beta-lactamase regulating signal transducer with metallopeptidase domain